MINSILLNECYNEYKIIIIKCDMLEEVKKLAQGLLGDLYPHLNGYVCVPKNHVLYGVDYNDIYTNYPNITCHGGLTFSGTLDIIDEPEYWIIGFDCAHLEDTYEKCNFDYVKNECIELIKCCEEAQLTVVNIFSNIEATIESVL